MEADSVVAKEMLTVVRDDFDGSKGASEITFGLDSVTYVIDLSPKNEEKLRQLLNPYLDVATRVREEHAGRGHGATRMGPDKQRNGAIRRWAIDQGVELPQRGRIAGAVIAAYDTNDKAALYEAVGLELVEAPRRGRRRASLEAQFAGSN
jgi:hypothetical protein